jgi:hypothetical protein
MLPVVSWPATNRSMVFCTAVSTRLSIEVRIHLRSASLAVRLWSESTPMAYFCLAAAWEITPAPVPPAAW